MIGRTTNSEDKKLGYFFCKAKDGVISAETFVGKVIFYLWNDVFKDYDFCDQVFNDADGNKLTFDKFYTAEGNNSKVVEGKVKLLLKNLKLQPIETDGEEDTISESTEDESNRDMTRYAINGEGNYPKRLLAKELIARFVKMHPELNADSVIEQWKPLSNVTRFVESDIEHEQRTEDGKKRAQVVTCSDGTHVWVATHGWVPDTVNALIDNVSSKEWGLRIETID